MELKDSPHEKAWPEILDCIQTRAWRGYYVADEHRPKGNTWPDVVHIPVKPGHSYFVHKDDAALQELIQQTKTHPISAFDLHDFLTRPSTDPSLIVHVEWSVAGWVFMREPVNVDTLKENAFESKIAKLRKACPTFDYSVVMYPEGLTSKSGTRVEFVPLSPFVHAAIDAGLFDRHGFCSAKQGIFWCDRGPVSWKGLSDFLLL